MNASVASFAAMERFSYRTDLRVPRFDDRYPIVVMDGECALCTGAARTIARMDKEGEFRICPVQSDLGSGLLQHYGLNPDDPSTWLYLEDGVAHGSMDGVIRAGKRLGGIGRGLVVLLILPKPMRDWIYNMIARNRIRVFGRADMCATPDEALKKRLLL